MPLPRVADGRLLPAADITCRLRPDAHTSPQRILCHTYGRGKDQHIPVPGWPYSVICALEAGRSSWTAPLDALRLVPGDDAATVTAQQMRELTGRLMDAGQWKNDDLARPPNKLTPARVRRDLRHLRPQAACPARAPNPSRPGPGRPPGRKNTRPTPRHDVHTVRKPDTGNQRAKQSTTPRPRRTG